MTDEDKEKVLKIIEERIKLQRLYLKTDKGLAEDILSSLKKEDFIVVKVNRE